MVELNSARLDRVFHALSDSTRRDMLKRLASGEHTVGELAEPFHMSLAAASKHIRTLEDAGLIRRTVEGRTHRCRIEPRPLAGIQSWLRRYESFWNQRLDALERALKE
jgi:DNA-binding transcriptional ArsR family regulator